MGRTPDEPVEPHQIVSADAMVRTVRMLADPELEGRLSGSPGEHRAAEKIAQEFRRLDLEPLRFLPGEPGLLATTDLPVRLRPYAQAFPVRRVDIVRPVSLVIHIRDSSFRAEPGGDAIPAADSPPLHQAAPVWFVGYGISDTKTGYDDYAGTDVRGAIVLFIAREPPGMGRYYPHAEKVREARNRGAIGYLTVTGPRLTRHQRWAGAGGQATAHTTGLGAEEASLPGFQISQELADRLLGSAGLRLAASQEQIDGSGRPASALLPATVEVDLAAENTPIAPALNIVGVLPGADEALRSQAILIVAHHDHFGRLGGVLFPGADDNASGTAVLLELARVLRQTGPARSILFLSTSGEEQGLLGSRYFVARPAWPLERIRAVINVDHVGVGSGLLSVGASGIGSERVDSVARRIGLGGRVQIFGLFPGGDHEPFATRIVPTLTIVSNGPRPDFHRPTDTPDKIDSKILKDAARLAAALAWDLANEGRQPPQDAPPAD